MAHGDHAILPKDASMSYLAEGAANIVYRISVPPGTPGEAVSDSYGDGTPPPTEIDTTSFELQVFENKLLRLRKDLPTTASCAIAQAAWLRLIAPLFDSHHIVNQHLVEIGSATVIEKLNKELRDQETEHPIEGSLPELGRRPRKQHGTYLAVDEYGLLVTDMTPGTKEEVVIEFKTKWLLQSPSAPKGSTRCRQCARVARSNAKRTRNGEALRKIYCPLDLVSKDPLAIRRVTQNILGSEVSATTTARFTHWLETNTLLPQLRSKQELLDRKGVLEADTEEQKFLVCMTLRDCTVFVRFPDDEHAEVEARIGDLDVKSPRKAEYWKNVEMTLIEEGWYLGTEKQEDCQPLTCSLSLDR